MDTKQKYVRIGRYNEVIIFPCVIEHSAFKQFNPISAGFCYVDAENKIVKCFGESFSLGLVSNPKEDTLHATKQVFGVDETIKLL